MIINPRAVIQDIVAVRRLRFLLWFELSTSLLYILHFLGFYLLYLVLLVTALFTPYVLFVLLKEKRFGWILIFFFLLKYSVDDWLQAYNAQEQLEEQRIASEERIKNEMLFQ